MRTGSYMMVRSKGMKMKKINVDQTIRALWLAFRELSDLIDSEEWTEEDVNPWALVTKHSAVQSRLEMKG